MSQEPCAESMNDCVKDGDCGARNKRKRTFADSVPSWHHSRLQEIRRLRECLSPVSEMCDFATVLENILVVKRFGDADSNRYCDAFAAYCREQQQRIIDDEPQSVPQPKRRRMESSDACLTGAGDRPAAAAAAASGQLLPFAMKVIPFSEHEALAHTHRDSPLSYSALRHSTWVERAIMLMCNELITAQCTPALPFLIRSYVSPEPFSALASRQKRGDAGLILCSEWAQSGNLLQWAIAQGRRPAKHWHCILFHVLVALYALQKYCNVTHHDLHLENVLLLTVTNAKTDGVSSESSTPQSNGQRPKFWQYRVDGEMYYVPECLGFMPLLWDFGIAHRPHVLTNRSFRHVYEERKLNRSCVDAENLLTIISDMRDNGEISFPSTSWNPYGTVLSWNTWSLQCAIPFLFKRHFGRRPRDNSFVIEPCYDVTRDHIVPEYRDLAPFFCAPSESNAASADLRSVRHSDKPEEIRAVNRADTCT